MVDLSTLSRPALAAAMKGGTEGWGQFASATDTVRYAVPVRPKSRRKCHCGCGMRATHVGMANGCALTTACELGIRRWIKTCSVRAATPAMKELQSCKRCGGTGVVDDGEIDCYEDGTPYLNGPVKCIKDCPACALPTPSQEEQP